MFGSEFFTSKNRIIRFLLSPKKSSKVGMDENPIRNNPSKQYISEHREQNMSGESDIRYSGSTFYQYARAKITR